MAIVGFLVHTLVEECCQVERAIAAMPEMTTYGIHQDCFIVAVAEAPKDELEYSFAKVHEVQGVLATYVTSMTTEDELL
jgi:nitrate reductase NapAB chaperone NapD